MSSPPVGAARHALTTELLCCAAGDNPRTAMRSSRCMLRPSPSTRWVQGQEANGSLEVRSSRHVSSRKSRSFCRVYTHAPASVCASRPTHRRVPLGRLRSAEDCVRSRNKCRSDLQHHLASEPSRQIASLRRDRMPQHGVWNGPCELWFLSESVSCLGRMKNAQRAHTLQVSQRARFAWQI